jgi:predicted RNase H-like HicB family nuclease
MTKRKALPRKAMTETVYTYTVLFEPAAEGGYTVTVPALPGVITEGDTLEEARARATDAIRGHITVLRKYRQPVPQERRAGLRRPITERLRVAVPV